MKISKRKSNQNKLARVGNAQEPAGWVGARNRKVTIGDRAKGKLAVPLGENYERLVRHSLSNDSTGGHRSSSAFLP